MIKLADEFDAIIDNASLSCYLDHQSTQLRAISNEWLRDVENFREKLAHIDYTNSLEGMENR